MLEGIRKRGISIWSHRDPQNITSYDSLHETQHNKDEGLIWIARTWLLELT